MRVARGVLYTCFNFVPEVFVDDYLNVEVIFEMPQMVLIFDLIRIF